MSSVAKIDKLQQDLKDAVMQAYNAGARKEVALLLKRLKSKRSSLNSQRGGSFCSKPHLLPINYKIELLDELIKSFETRLKVLS